MRMRWNIDAGVCGIGDAIIAAWCAEGANASGQGLDIRFCSGRNDPILLPLGQPITQEPNGLALLHCFKQTGQRLVGIGIEPWHSLASLNWPWRAAPKRPRVTLADEDRAWAWEISRRAEGPLIMLCPTSAYAHRSWPEHYWVRLAWALHPHCHVLGVDFRPDAMRSLPRYYFGFSLSRVLALMELADLVICNESGPAHMAGTLDRRALVLCGPSDPVTAMGQYPSVRCLQVSAERVPCVGCHWRAEKGCGPACSTGCQALYDLRWQDVFEAAKEELLTWPGTSLNPSSTLTPSSSAPTSSPPTTAEPPSTSTSPSSELSCVR